MCPSLCPCTCTGDAAATSAHGDSSADARADTPAQLAHRHLDTHMSMLTHGQAYERARRHAQTCAHTRICRRPRSQSDCRPRGGVREGLGPPPESDVGGAGCHRSTVLRGGGGRGGGGGSWSRAGTPRHGVKLGLVARVCWCVECVAAFVCGCQAPS